MNIVDYAIKVIVMNTKYSAYQCYRVLEIISKWGEKALYHCNKSQKEILSMLVYMLTPPTEGEE